MIIPGICSISFRSLSAEELIGLCGELKIPAIEWGGDIHAPHGDVIRAREIKDKCEKAGILCPSYGSYYKVGLSEKQGLPFSAVLDSALALGAGTVRVWGGEKNYTDYSPAELDNALEDTKRIARMASENGLALSFEYHENTLTHTPEAVKALGAALDAAPVSFYWQPPHVFNDNACLSSLRALGESLTHLHVFHWLLTDSEDPEERIQRRPLSEGIDRWVRFLGSLPSGSDHCAYLEFVQGDDPLQLRKDWESFKIILKRI